MNIVIYILAAIGAIPVFAVGVLLFCWAADTFLLKVSKKRQEQARKEAEESAQRCRDIDDIFARFCNLR